MNTTTVPVDRYIWPPRPDAAIPRDETDFLKGSTWIAQLKYNDSRCLVKYLPDNTVELWNRHGEKFRSYTCPDWLAEQLLEVRFLLGLAPNEYHLLDGGLLDAKHRAIKDTIVVWDVLVDSGMYQVGTTYRDRYEKYFGAHTRQRPFWNFSHQDYEKSHTFGFALTKNTFFPSNHKHQTWDELWERVHAVNKPWLNMGVGPLLEGLVFKDLSGKLKRAYREKNNQHWVMRSRVATGRHAF